MQHLIEHTGIHRFRFITESIPPAFARRFSKLLLERQVHAGWRCFAMVDHRFDRDLLALMVEAGCEGLVVGLETMITRVLKLVHKSADREENIRFLHDARDVGMPLSVLIIPDLPSTTYEEAMAALDDLRGLADCVQSVSIAPFEPTRSSNVGRHPDRLGLLAGQPGYRGGQAQYGLNHLDSVDPAMTDKQRAEVHRAYQRFADAVQRQHAPSRARPADLAGATTVRVPAEELDVLPAGDQLVLTQIRTKKRIILRGEIARLLGPYLDGSPFTLSELNGRTDDRATPSVARALTEAGLLVGLADSRTV